MSASLNSYGGAPIYEDLLPALIQCFTIILFGYLSGRLGLVGSAEAAGLKVFATCFALPAIAFKSLATLRLIDVNWKFLAAVFLAKSAVFATAALLTILVSPRPTSYAKAGLYAIASSQSNDFALGYTLISHLYARTHPTFCHYLYLIAPLQLVVLNPVGFVLMEYGSDRNDGAPLPLRRKVFASVTNIFKNPVVFMPMVGVVWNFATDGGELPRLCAGVVDSLGDAFSASALYLLGLSMVGQLSSMTKYAALTPTLIVSAKILLLPLLLRQLINLLAVGSTPAETAAFGSFGFLYGMLPTAPNVFVFAAQYGLPTAAVSVAMVAGTLLSAPCIFVSATMARLSMSSLDDSLATLGKAVVYAGAVGGACSLYVLFVLSRKISRVTHGATFCLVTAQLLTAVGGVLWSVADFTSVGYLQFVLSLSGIFASRIWTALLAILLATLHWRSLCFVLRVRRIVILLGFGASAAIACAVCLGVLRPVSHFGRADPNFRFGRIQADVAASVLTVTLIVTIAALVIQQRSRIRTRGYAPLSGSNDEEESAGPHADSQSPQPPAPDSIVAGSAPISHESHDRLRSPQSSSPPALDSKTDGCTGDCETCNNCSEEEEPQVAITDMEDILHASKVRSHRRKTHESRKQLSINCTDSDASPVPSTSAGRPEDGLCGPEFDCDKDKVKDCLMAIETYTNRITLDGDNDERNSADAEDEDPHQLFRHVVLLILLSGSMIVGLAVSLWRPLTDGPTGILVELEFLDVLLNYGQGVLSFAVFGLDPKHAMRPFLILWRRITRQTNPSGPEISAETMRTCRRFDTYHRMACAAEIGTEFRGRDLLDWLQSAGLCADQTEAEQYGRHLSDGGTIQRVGIEDGGHVYALVPAVR